MLKIKKTAIGLMVLLTGSGWKSGRCKKYRPKD